MREIVSMMAGQCGNQIGAKFWEVISGKKNAAGNVRLVNYTQFRWNFLKLKLVIKTQMNTVSTPRERITETVICNWRELTCTTMRQQVN